MNEFTDTIHKTQLSKFLNIEKFQKTRKLLAFFPLPVFLYSLWSASPFPADQRITR
jgi:hypothetical protein